MAGTQGLDQNAPAVELDSAAIPNLDVSALFSDDGPVKQNVHNRLADGMKGWGPIYGEPSYQKDTVSHVESFDIGQYLTPQQCEELGTAANIWPDLRGFESTVLEYSEAVTRMGRAISEVISELLEMPADFINHNSGISAPRTMRLLHYPDKTTAAAIFPEVGFSAAVVEIEIHGQLFMFRFQFHCNGVAKMLRHITTATRFPNSRSRSH